MMIFKGIIVAILPVKSGVSQKSGKEWQTQEFVVKNDDGRFPEMLVFSVFNKEIGAAIGDAVEVKFDCAAREWNGRWFNDLKAFEITKLSPVQATPMTTPPPPVRNEDDLPF